MTEPRKTPRTDARLVKYRNGSPAAFFRQRICYANFTRQLEIETQELAEALDTLTLVVGLTPLAGNRDALQEAFNLARAALARHHANQSPQ